MYRIIQARRCLTQSFLAVEQKNSSWSVCLRCGIRSVLLATAEATSNESQARHHVSRITDLCNLYLLRALSKFTARGSRRGESGAGGGNVSPCETHMWQSIKRFLGPRIWSLSGNLGENRISGKSPAELTLPHPLLDCHYCQYCFPNICMLQMCFHSVKHTSHTF